MTAQVTDKNFKDETGDGFSVVVFTSEWQEKDLDKDILTSVKGHEDAVIITVKSEEVKKVVKKLRLRNFPSVALFHDGSKKEVWKADMDGELDVSSSDIKDAIDDVLAEDVF
jgi:thioredoxin-like negative regulator of GroEL|tara:strand:+ start:253 stop:588 length:336 start_codon:yes stop_codon:yes gene_type:complete